jgi:hypothetical protein
MAISKSPAQNRNFAAGEGVHRMVKESDVWSILLRYQVNAERQYRRALEDFERLKSLRPEMPNHPDIGAAPDVIEVAPLKEINPLIRLETLRLETIRLEPEPSEVEPAVASPVEPSNVAPNAPENAAPGDGAPLAPAAASTPKTPTSRSRGGNGPESSSLKTAPAAGRLKVKPFASLRRPNPRPTAPASKARNSVSSLRNSPCRPVSPLRDIQAVLPATIAKQPAPAWEGNCPREDPPQRPRHNGAAVPAPE